MNFNIFLLPILSVIVCEQQSKENSLPVERRTFGGYHGDIPGKGADFGNIAGMVQSLVQTGIEKFGPAIAQKIQSAQQGQNYQQQSQAHQQTQSTTQQAQQQTQQQVQQTQQQAQSHNQHVQSNQQGVSQSQNYQTNTSQSQPTNKDPGSQQPCASNPGGNCNPVNPTPVCDNNNDQCNKTPGIIKDPPSTVKEEPKQKYPTEPNQKSYQI